MSGASLGHTLARASLAAPVSLASSRTRRMTSGAWSMSSLERKLLLMYIRLCTNRSSVRHQTWPKAKLCRMELETGASFATDGCCWLHCSVETREDSVSRLHSPGRLFGLNLVGDVRHVKQQTDEPLTAGRWSQIGSVRTDVDLQCQDESLWRPWAECSSGSRPLRRDAVRLELRNVFPSCRTSRTGHVDVVVVIN